MEVPHRIAGLGLAAYLALAAPGAAGQTPSKNAAPAPAIPENAIALEGTPTVRLDATPDGATRRQLDGAEAAQQGLKVDVVNGRYYWASRGHRPLTLSSSGAFTYLSSAEPGQYVRFRRINDRISYVEHVDTPLGSVTYWGELQIVLRK